MPVNGLTGIASLGPVENDNSFATAEQRSGYPVNPVHSHFGEQAKPYPSRSQLIPQETPRGPFGTDALMIEEFGWSDVAESGRLEQDPYSERMPWTHAGPWPSDPIGDQSESPDNVARQLRQNYALRGRPVTDSGKNNTYSRNFAKQDKWQEIWEVDPGHIDLETVGPQMRSGMAPGGRGQTDRTQSNAHQNSYGYDSHHFHRRFATGSIPGNYMWMRPGGRPMIKGLAGPARPAVGPTSPFAGDDLGDAFAYDSGAILQRPASEYVAPPEPYLAPTIDATHEDAQGPTDVEWF